MSRRLVRCSVLVGAVLAVVACGGGGDLPSAPGVGAEGVGGVTPAPRVTDTAAPTPVTPAPATPEPTLSSEPLPPGTVAISASNDSSYDQDRIVAPAEVSLTFRFTNDDPYFTHNVAVRAAKPDGSDFVGLPVAQMGTTVDYLAPAMSAGTFEIYCTVHPTMISTLVVE